MPAAISALNTPLPLPSSYVPDGIRSSGTYPHRCVSPAHHRPRARSAAASSSNVACGASRAHLVEMGRWGHGGRQRANVAGMPTANISSTNRTATHTPLLCCDAGAVALTVSCAPEASGSSSADARRSSAPRSVVRGWLAQCTCGRTSARPPAAPTSGKRRRITGCGQRQPETTIFGTHTSPTFSICGHRGASLPTCRRFAIVRFGGASCCRSRTRPSKQ